ncbi:AlpA family transcriptional regulator [Citrobacter portucalensis]|uniref:helix-turn-helix transcriptional regulator n=1 Tax=Citrobacter sp. Cu096 TaxID=2985158 RepID=UPI001079BEA3|nr:MULTISPECIES: AlpA family transcriptional regulator [Citrobacter]EDR8962854.1 AlpA family transcriptional regulator [Salmonella enterica subsp. enterica]EEJ7601613.1 AlpA family transcriptional regulator [Salmonella enterica subsp. enterica serovar Kiambu]MCX9046717.1 AlpA family transcriptional regulator [Citrobacter portucalensis]MDM2739554.1 AlpA family transcriptional regulator [Citrobacter sp. Cu096]
MGRQLEPTSLIDMRYMTNDSGFTSKYFYGQIKTGNLPPPIKFGRSSRWLLSDYEQWKQSHKRNDK